VTSVSPKGALRRILREPLLHFLLAGAALYLLHGLFAGNEEEASSRHIIVDRPALLRYMQYQARAFEPATFDASLDAMSDGERRRLIDEYVKEEVLYREAQALGLAQGDYVMRQRLVQKMSFLLEAEPAHEPADVGLQEYLQANEGLYRVEPAWTFTHVFIDATQHGGMAGAEQAAHRQLAALRGRSAGFNDAPAYGDRFAFMQNYVERTADYIESHFGAQFTLALQQLPVRDNWQGPLQSVHGWHLVMLTASTPGRLPQLGEIRARVLDDWRRDQAAALQAQAVGALVESYEVELRALETME
jgi:hypothetical protein